LKFLTNILHGILGLLLISIGAHAAEVSQITQIISKEEFSSYKDVADFIDNSPKVTKIVKPEPEDIEKYGSEVVKSLTGSDCDRDGKMDDNAKCNAVYYKLWMIYAR